MSPYGDSWQGSVECNSLEEQLALVPEWLSWVRAEVEEPDLWATIGQEKRLLEAASAPDVEDIAFTSEERDQISVRLTEIEKQLIDHYQLTGEGAARVSGQLNNLKSTLTALGRQSWMTLAIGTAFTIGTTLVGLGFASDISREVGTFLVQNFSQIVNDVLHLSPPPLITKP